MIDIVFPDGNEDEFIETAARLGLSGLCFAYDKPRDVSGFQKRGGLKICSAVLCRPEDARKFRQNHLTISRAPDDPSKLRVLFETHRPHLVFGVEGQKRSDFVHHRASGLNHVMATIAREKGVCIGFSLSDILNTRGPDRAVLLGRISQNIHFARKFKFKVCIASFAQSPWQMRGEKDMISLFVSLGMSGNEAKEAVRRDDCA